MSHVGQIWNPCIVCRWASQRLPFRLSSFCLTCLTLYFVSFITERECDATDKIEGKFRRVDWVWPRGWEELLCTGRIMSLFKQLWLQRTCKLRQQQLKQPTVHVHVDAWRFFVFPPDLATHYKSQVTVDKLISSFECYNVSTPHR